MNECNLQPINRTTWYHFCGNMVDWNTSGSDFDLYVSLNVVFKLLYKLALFFIFRKVCSKFDVKYSMKTLFRKSVSFEYPKFGRKIMRSFQSISLAQYYYLWNINNFYLSNIIENTPIGNYHLPMRYRETKISQPR